ncbi:MAG: hypothetical protein ACI9R3_005451 [Verrucomicrobiales bacterium]|jgi:hypothetical protein
MRTDRRSILRQMSSTFCALATGQLVSAYGQEASRGMPRVYTPTRTRALRIRYPWRQRITTTIFWIGEDPTAKNPTPNHASSWDPKWEINYGGFDSPDPRKRAWDYRPAAFIPKENPFYCALPFNDITEANTARRVIPWRRNGSMSKSSRSLCKSHWIAVRYGRKICYAQWEDCGPFVTDDWPYVFGYSRPKNQYNNSAGLDVSPSVRDYLKIRSGAPCDWRFVDLSEVPPGPWRRYGSNNHFVKTTKDSKEDQASRMVRLRKAREEWLKNAR